MHWSLYTLFERVSQSQSWTNASVQIPPTVIDLIVISGIWFDLDLGLLSEKIVPRGSIHERNLRLEGQSPAFEENNKMSAPFWALSCNEHLK